MIQRCLGASLLSLLSVSAGVLAQQTPTTPPPIEHFVERDAFYAIKISPDGQHLAASMPVEGGSALFMLETETLAKKGHFFAGKDMEVANFWWSSDQRLLMSIAQRFPGDEKPTPTGEIYATNVDGNEPTALIGFRADDGRRHTRIKKRENELVWAAPIDLLPGEDREALVQIVPMSARTETHAAIERLNTQTGRRVKVANSPVVRAEFLTDAQGNLRFAQGANVKNEVELYHREASGGDWVLVNAQGSDGPSVFAHGFSTDGASAYLQVSRSEGPDAIERLDIASGNRTEVYRHKRRDPAGAIYSLDGNSVLGVYVREPQRVAHYFEPDHPEAKLRQSLAVAFQGHDVEITSATRDGRKAILFVYSDRNPGEYFLFDRDTNGARHIGSRGRNLVPEQMGTTRSVQIEARDGLLLDGLLTLPPGGPEANLPLVVHPHGGPFDVEDVWGFDPTVQLLATRGYAVLQVNFRGSGGFGGAFERAGYKQWGKAMQDDLTDATRWAIAQGTADPSRICLFGASYGGYASLMGVAKEPDLYACAVGNVGVYDLELMYRRGDIQQLRSGRNYLREALGEDGLAEHSPVNLASAIKVPVFLSAGEEDRRAPIQHTERMENALRKVGVPVETLYFRGEGHGYYSTENKLKFNQQLLAFLDRTIGSARVTPPPASP
jgi:dipeptidyl aminopeptidase/acylaminoacyl peptidase